MNLKKAVAIVLNIEVSGVSIEEKAYAIKLVSEMETCNSITKRELLTAARWLINNIYEFDEVKEGGKDD